MNKKNVNKTPELSVKVYKQVSLTGERMRRAADANLLLKFRVFLRDRPGSLAAFSSLIADCCGNISFFHYDRSVDSSRVVVEVRMNGQHDLDSLLMAMKAKKYAFERVAGVKDEVEITTPANILEIKVRLVNRPGTLAAFARLLKKHHANVIYMLYDEDIDAESANIAMAVKEPGEIDNLLHAINSEGYYYRVIYRGSGKAEIEHIIGLKLVEKFFIRLRKLLSDSDTKEVKALVESSQELSDDLVQFYAEAGNNLEAADVFEKVLTLASLSRSSVGRRFSAVEMPPLPLGKRVTLFGFRLPTSENIYVFQHDGELTMIDAGYGIYYDDIKKLFKGKKWDLSRIKRIFITHADADHAGTSGYFADEFGTQVFMHHAGKDVIAGDNRSFGHTGKLSKLNKYYTRLVNRFTNCRFPRKARYFRSSVLGSAGAFNVIDRVLIGDLQFEVLESRGGHVPGNVFFLNREYGLLFTADYLLNIKSLTEEDRNALNVYKYLLISPNSNGPLFKEEMAALQELVKEIDAKVKKQGRSALIFPGHGEYYPLEQAR
ncbi:MAG: MBL fold metallo-hydrolase [Nitrospiraceae bacterium]|nr:MAG: MBL fold metallo-hydrolase [Nitrospiraceae bacterium]